MARLGTHDNLIERISADDPAARVAPLPDATLSRIVRHAMTPKPRIWSRRQFGLASFGALVGSGGLVLVGILGLEAAAPSLPLLTLGKIPQVSVAMRPQSYLNSTSLPIVDYAFESVHGLAEAPKAAITYRLVSPLRAVNAATALAATLDVHGTAFSLQRGSYRVGASAGPTVTTWTSGGVVEWSYHAAAALAHGDSLLSEKQLDAVPSVKRADTVARSLFSRLEAAPTFGLAEGSRTRDAVNVEVPVVVGGSATDQVDALELGPSGVLESASGLLAQQIAGPSYPTISAGQAIAVLRADHGFVFYGGIAPVEGAVSSPLSARQSTSGEPTAYGNSVAVPSSGPPPVVHVDIDHATLQYATYVLANGTSWLLPTWSLSGTEHGAGVTAGARYLAYVLAIAPQYVRLESASAAP